MKLPYATVPDVQPSISPRALLTQGATEPEPTLKRPTVKPRKSTNLRTSFAPSATESEEGEGVRNEVIVVPKRSNNLSRVAVQRNAKPSQRASLLASQLPRRRDDDDDNNDDDDPTESARPSYSTANLQALKDSTPSTPAAFTPTLDQPSVQDLQTRTRDLELTSKFSAAALARYQDTSSSAIPSASEIAEKKARRARLAKEHAAEEFISLDPDDPGLDRSGDEEEDGVDGDPNVMRDEQGRLLLKPKDPYKMAESRLANDEDEDMMEGFESFTEDGKVALGKRAEREAQVRRREEMRVKIAEAEGHNLSDAEDEEDDGVSSTSSRDRTAAFEAAQTRHGTYASQALNSTSSSADQRPKTPPKISPLPTLDGVLEGLRRRVQEMREERVRMEGVMVGLGREKIRLAGEEVRIQGALKEAGERFRGLRGGEGAEGLVERAGDGGAPEVVEERLDGDEGEEARSNGLGFAGMRASEGWVGVGGSGGDGEGLRSGMGGMSGMGGRQAAEDDW